MKIVTRTIGQSDSFEIWYWRRQDSPEKTVMLGKVEGNRKGGRPNMKWIYSIKKATGLSLQKMSGAIEDKTDTLGGHSFIGSP